MNPLALIPGSTATRYAIGAAVLVVVMLFLRMHWINQGREQVLRENVSAAVKIVTKQGEVTERVVTKYVKVRGVTQIVTDTVEKEVVKYANANPGVCLDADWGRLHDSAATNTVSKPAAGPDGEARAPEAATALQTVTENYAACNRTADRLDALQEWVREQHATTHP